MAIKVILKNGKDKNHKDYLRHNLPREIDIIKRVCHPNTGMSCLLLPVKPDYRLKDEYSTLYKQLWNASEDIHCNRTLSKRHVGIYSIEWITSCQRKTNLIPFNTSLAKFIFKGSVGCRKELFAFIWLNRRRGLLCDASSYFRIAIHAWVMTLTIC